MCTCMRSCPRTLNRALAALPVGQGWEAMSARCRASDLGNLLCWGTLLLVHKSIGFMSMPLDEQGAAEVLRAVNRLFNSPGHQPGGCCFFLITQFYYFPPSPHSIVLLHWLHFSQCSYSQWTSAYRNVAWRDCECVYICVCVRRRDFWPLKTCGVLSSSTVSILSDPLGCSTHIQHPSLSAIFLHARLSTAPSFRLCFSLFHIASLSLLPPPPFSFQLQTEAAN